MWHWCTRKGIWYKHKCMQKLRIEYEVWLKSNMGRIWMNDWCVYVCWDSHE